MMTMDVQWAAGVCTCGDFDTMSTTVTQGTFRMWPRGKLGEVRCLVSVALKSFGAPQRGLHSPKTSRAQCNLQSSDLKAFLLLK